MGGSSPDFRKPRATSSRVGGLGILLGVPISSFIPTRCPGMGEYRRVSGRDQSGVEGKSGFGRGWAGSPGGGEPGAGPGSTWPRWPGKALPEGTDTPLTLRYRLPNLTGDPADSDTEFRFKLYIPGKALKAGHSAVVALADAALPEPSGRILSAPGTGFPSSGPGGAVVR